MKNEKLRFSSIGSRFGCQCQNWPPKGRFFLFSLWASGGLGRRTTKSLLFVLRIIFFFFLSVTKSAGKGSRVLQLEARVMSLSRSRNCCPSVQNNGLNCGWTAFDVFRSVWCAPGFSFGFFSHHAPLTCSSVPIACIRSD